MTTNPTPESDAVAARLRAASADYPDLPTAVADRLDRALAELPDLTAPDTGAAPSPAPAARRPWWRGGFALASLSLVVAAFLGGGLLFALQPWNGGGADTSAAQERTDDEAKPFQDKNDDKRQEDSGSESEPGVGKKNVGYTLSYSGRDYGDRDLLDAPGMSAVGEAAAVPEALRPLATDANRRDECLAEQTGVYGGSVDLVDFGGYRGDPAMIVVIAAESGGGMVVAVGPDCRSGEPDVLATETFD